MRFIYDRMMLRRPRRLPPRPDDGLVCVNQNTRTTILMTPQEAHNLARSKMADHDRQPDTIRQINWGIACRSPGCSQKTMNGQDYCGTCLSRRLYPPPQSKEKNAS